MTDIPTETPSVDTDRPLVVLPKWARGVVAGAAGLLAFLHLALPDLAIDAVFLGLVAFALFVMLFDIDAIEWLGIRARRRQLERKKKEVKALPVPTGEVRAAPPPAAPSAGTPTPQDAPIVQKPAVDLMPPSQPGERLLWVAEHIRIELILLAGNTGSLPDRRGFDRYGAVTLAAHLAAHKLVPVALINPIETVVAQRNALVHGPYGWRVIGMAAGDLGIEVLSKLRSIKTEYVRVIAYPIHLYRDGSLSAKHSTDGVMIEQIGFEGQRLPASVYPTAGKYVPGRFVTWEWDATSGIDSEAWYEDLGTGQPRVAFSSAAYFAGREYPEQWGVEFRGPGPMIL